MYLESGLYSKAAESLVSGIQQYTEEFNSQASKRPKCAQEIRDVVNQHEGLVRSSFGEPIRESLRQLNKGPMYIDAYFLGWRWCSPAYDVCERAYTTIAAPLSDPSTVQEGLAGLADALEKSPCVLFSEPEERLAAFFLSQSSVLMFKPTFKVIQEHTEALYLDFQRGFKHKPQDALGYKESWIPLTVMEPRMNSSIPTSVVYTLKVLSKGVFQPLAIFSDSDYSIYLALTFISSGFDCLNWADYVRLGGKIKEAKPSDPMRAIVAEFTSCAAGEVTHNSYLLQLATQAFRDIMDFQYGMSRDKITALEARTYELISKGTLPSYKLFIQLAQNLWHLRYCLTIELLKSLNVENASFSLVNTHFSNLRYLKFWPTMFWSNVINPSNDQKAGYQFLIGIGELAGQLNHESFTVPAPNFQDLPKSHQDSKISDLNLLALDL
ncbi:hypothetical protein PSACC_02311 [Paramicrosporidium saccamoebae]|uniref:Uncharacterized protein n=1 Tax=Paramicrosporidium saccamoebae TaxID=1246581 RepID=A0A2H9TJH0_9FUNG|nr:hypothetical protein PSACC_02311 [Paramicrosporidium saccamoebae]